MITIYSTTYCAYCPLVAKLCEKYQVPYQKIELDDKPELRQKIIHKTGIITVPITTDGETYVAGWQPAKLMELINR